MSETGALFGEDSFLILGKVLMIFKPSSSFKRRDLTARKDFRKILIFSSDITKLVWVGFLKEDRRVQPVIFGREPILTLNNAILDSCSLEEVRIQLLKMCSEGKIVVNRGTLEDLEKPLFISDEGNSLVSYAFNLLHIREYPNRMLWIKNNYALSFQENISHKRISYNPLHGTLTTYLNDFDRQIYQDNLDPEFWGVEGDTLEGLDVGIAGKDITSTHIYTAGADGISLPYDKLLRGVPTSDIAIGVSSIGVGSLIGREAPMMDVIDTMDKKMSTERVQVRVTSETPDVIVGQLLLKELQDNGLLHVDEYSGGKHYLLTVVKP